MYKIGDFSKLVGIPVRTLRYYAECGVLIPNLIDRYTGYKYYNDENIVECELIKLLKSLDFTLDEIIEYKGCLDEKIIEKKKREIEERIKLLKLKYKRLCIMEIELNNNKKYINSKESEEEKILRRKYDKRKIGKSD